MKLPAQVESLDEATGVSTAPIHLAVGMFDGVHLGHQAVIEAAKQSAHRTWGVSGVLTFSPHPSRVFRPNDPTLLLMPMAQKMNFLRYFGVQLIVNHPFTPAFAAIEAADFPGFLKEKLPTLKALYIGENFRFGKARKGTVKELIEYAEPLGIDVFSVERIKQNGEPISSTRIRGVITDGKIEQVNDLLGYTYRSEGAVVAGRQLGRTIDFPTLNFHWEPELAPKYGVYAVRLKAKGTDEWIPGVANYGVRPTVEESSEVRPLLEVHLFAEAGLPVGTEAYVEWFQSIRKEKKFPDIESLKKQINLDCEAAKKLLKL